MATVIASWQGNTYLRVGANHLGLQGKVAFVSEWPVKTQSLGQFAKVYPKQG